MQSGAQTLRETRALMTMVIIVTIILREKLTSIQSCAKNLYGIFKVSRKNKERKKVFKANKFFFFSDYIVHL